MSFPRVALAGLAAFCSIAAAAPARAHALEPVGSVEVVLGAQDVPGARFIGAQPRLALRLDREAPVSFYGWLGMDVSLFAPTDGEYANGHGFDGAMGGDARACTASGLCVGLHATLGAQYVAYHHGDADIGPTPGASSTSAFVDLEPYVSIGRLTVAVDARVHRLLDPGQYEDDLVRYAGGVSFGYVF
jgi:hypothetical protein